MKNLMILVVLGCTLCLSCSKEEESEMQESLEQMWDVQLDGADFDVSNTQLFAYYQSFSGDFIVGGTKNTRTEERIVLTFNVDDGAPFINQGALDMGENSGNSILYFAADGEEYSTLLAPGSGSFTVTKFIDTDTRDFLSGSFEGQLYSTDSGSSVTVKGIVAARSF